MLKLSSSLCSVFQHHTFKVLSLTSILILFGAAGALFSVNSQSNEGENNLTVINAASPTPTPTPHTLVGSFYTTELNTDAKLLLNNKGISQLEVTPTLYNAQGQELQLPPVTVEPQSFRFINLNDWAAIGGPTFKTGNIKLFHVGKDLVLGAQIYLTDHEHSLSYEEKLAEKGKFDSRKQEAVWWMPSNQADVKVVLTNTTAAPLTVIAKLAKKPNVVGNPQTFQLAAHETRLLDLQQDFINGSQFANSDIVGLSLEHTAVKDALLARVAVGEVTRGYSNVVQFSNPVGGSSQEYQGVGFQIGDIAGQQLTPVIVARNVGTTPATVTARVPYTRIDGTRGTITLPQKQLAAGEIGSLNTTLITQRVQQEQIKVASLEITYNTVAGSVIVAAHTVSADHNLVFRAPMWDPLGQRSPTGGYPWRIEDTSSTETYIKNITDVGETYVAFLLWENGGIYMIGINNIAAHETVHIDVKKLRDDQIPDERGRRIPLSVSSGQLQWTLRRTDTLGDEDARANLALIGRSEQVDAPNGIVNNYACQNCCSGDFVDGRLEAADPTQTFSSLEAGSSRFYFAVEDYQTCYGYEYGPIQSRAITTATWNSSNGNIATVSGGNVQGVSAGTTTISAAWRPRSSIVYPCPPGGGFTSETDGNQCDQPNEKSIEVSQEEIKEESTEKIAPPVTPNIAACGTCVTRTWQNDFVASLNLTVVPRVRILRDGTDITSTSQNNVQTVIVGQRINLSGTVTGGTPTSQGWDIPEKRIKKFEVLPAGTRQASSGMTIPVDGLYSTAVNFIWYDGEFSGLRKEVAYTVTVNGVSTTARATFDVKRPTVDLTMVAQPTFLGTTVINGATRWVITLANSSGTVQGATFTRQNTNIPSPFSGQFQFVQLYNYSLNGNYTTSTSTTPIPINQSENGLDGCYPYLLNDTLAEDKPALTLDNPNFVFQNVTANNAWSMFLMFKPSGTDSEWVPIKEVDWVWAYTVTRGTRPRYSSSGVTNPNATASGNDITTYPVWSYRVPDRSGDNCTSFAPSNLQLKLEHQ